MWFHDLGFHKGWEQHEERSAGLAAAFLAEHQVAPDRIERIKKYILATKKTAVPQNIGEQIVLDADAAHIGNKKYFDALCRLRSECEAHGEKKYSKKDWIKLNLEFLNNHKFYTTVAQNKFGDRKRKHLLKLHRQLKNLKEFELNKTTSEEDDPSSLIPKKNLIEA